MSGGNNGSGRGWGREIDGMDTEGTGSLVVDKEEKKFIVHVNSTLSVEHPILFVPEK